ncbi:MAG: glucokinase, partial [Brucellaceae bacterium]|nr:glucokinase [Brucellaceae bacterium]
MIVLACDLGGTNVRFGLGEAGKLARETVRQFPGDEFSGFEDAARSYLKLVEVTAVASAVIALAAPIDGDSVRLTNRDWTISRKEVATLSGAQSVVLINDFAALGAALSQRFALDTELMQSGPQGDGVRLVLGSGTGFNASALVAGNHVLSAEIGHTTFAPAPGIETELRDHYADAFGRCSHDRVLSGSGLLTLYRLLCASSGRRPATEKTSDVTTAAAEASDDDAVAACRTFAGMLGRTAGDLALTFLPYGGIYLTGSVTRALRPFIRGGESAFAQAFFAKGRMQG